MSILRVVKESLLKNPQITIVGNQDINLLPGRNSYWNHIVSFYVAPKKGLYLANELQSLQNSLLPDILPRQKEDFFKLGPYLMFGHLFLLEKIGIQIVHTSIEVKDDLIDLPDSFIDGKYESTDNIPLMRCIWVKLLPNVLIAKEVMKGNFEDKINKFDLLRYQLLQHDA